MATIFGPPPVRNQEATVYVGNLHEKVTEDLLYELFLQCGPVVNVYIPKDRVTNTHNGYGFVEFKNEKDADYALHVMNMVKLYSKPVHCNRASQDKNKNMMGANLFVGGLDADVDERMLEDCFARFGPLIQPPKIMRDDQGTSRGFGFVNFESYEAADAAIESMNGQFLCNKQVHVSYAFKNGQPQAGRFGSQNERLLANRSTQPTGMGAGNAPPPPPVMNVRPPGMMPPPMPPMGMGMGMGMGPPQQQGYGGGYPPQGPPPGMPPPMPPGGSYPPPIPGNGPPHGMPPPPPPY